MVSKEFFSEQFDSTVCDEHSNLMITSVYRYVSQNYELHAVVSVSCHSFMFCDFTCKYLNFTIDVNGQKFTLKSTRYLMESSLKLFMTCPLLE